MNITINVAGQEELKARFYEVIENIKDFRRGDVWGKVQRIFYKIEEKLFESEGSSGASGKWAVLSRPYAAIKEKRYGPVPILTASGEMRTALTSEASGSVVDKQAQSFSIGTSLARAGFHQSGTRNMPPRRVVDMTESDKKELLAPMLLRARQIADNAKLKDKRGL